VDIAGLGLGEPYAMFDYHQNYGDRPGKPDYVLHSTASDLATASVARQSAATVYSPYYARISALTAIADVDSDLTTQETLRGHMIARGVRLPLTFERSVYHSLGSEWTFGVATVQALVDPSMIVVPVEPTPDPIVTLPPPPTPPSDPIVVTPPVPEPVDPTPPVVTQPPPDQSVVLLYDEFTGSGGLNGRTPDNISPTGAVWSVHRGNLALDANGHVTTNETSRAVIETLGADVEAVVGLNLGSNDTGVILRASDSQNFLRFSLTSTGWFFQKTAGGATTTVSRGTAVLPLKTDYSVKVTLQGPTITLMIDGVLVKTVTESFNQTATRHGIVSSNTGARSWNSFTVRKL
jgi:hypothetical protein